MRVCAWALLIWRRGDVLPPLLLAGDPGGRAQYIGGTVAALPSKSEGRLNITGEEALLFRTKQASVRIPYTQINTLEYGQRVNRRYVEAVMISPPPLLANTHKHFLPVGYSAEHGQ